MARVYVLTGSFARRVGLFDFGDAALRRIFLELRRVVAGKDAVRISSSEFDHALLILDVSEPEIVGEGRAGFVFGEIAIEIAIVGSQDERRRAFDADVLRRVSVVSTGVGADAWKDLNVVAVHELQAALRIDPNEFADVFGVNAAVIAAGLPGVTRVVAKFILLNPDIRFGKKIDAAEMIPVSMANDDVGDFVGLDAGEFYRFVGGEVFGRREILEEGVAVIAAVEKDVVAATSDQPDDHSDVDFFAFRSAHHQTGDFIFGRSVANGLDRVVGRRCSRGETRKQSEKK